MKYFKILNGCENIDRNIFFSPKKDSMTRRHETTFSKGNDVCAHASEAVAVQKTARYFSCKYSLTTKSGIIITSVTHGDKPHLIISQQTYTETINVDFRLKRH